MDKRLRIVFAGTPAFGLACLEGIYQSAHELVGIYTQPDRPAGRGRQLQASAVKQWAQSHAIPVYQPLNFKAVESQHTLAALAPDVMVVIAYGLILPKVILETPRLGCINVHASLLPRWRGASPIQQAILHGDAETGVTIMQMDVGMDTGPLFTKVSIPLCGQNATQLHDELALLAVKPLLNTLDRLAQGMPVTQAQDDQLATYAPKIKKEDAVIQWQRPAIEIKRQIDAFNPWPVAFTTVKGELLRIYQAKVIAHDQANLPGKILSITPAGLLIATGEGQLLVETIQFPGGKILKVSEWLNAGRKELLEGVLLQ